MKIKKRNNTVALLSVNLKKLQTDKPGSVRILLSFGHHLSAMRLAPTPVSAYPRTSGEQPSIVRLLGISARKVYPNLLLPTNPVGSYPTFSPLPSPLRQAQADKAVIFCGTVCLSFLQDCAAVSCCVALCCPDFPPCRKDKAIAWFVARQR